MHGWFYQIRQIRRESLNNEKRSIQYMWFWYAHIVVKHSTEQTHCNYYVNMKKNVH